jgi:hypothetical protein
MFGSGRKQSPATLPSVNLLSPWVFDAIAVRRLRQRFVLGACALTLVVGAGWAVQHLRAVQASQILGIEQAESARLTDQTQALAPIRVYVSSVEHQKQTVTETMRREVRFSRILDGLALATPADANVESVAVTLASPATPTAADPTAATPGGGSVCPGPDPFQTREVVGCITLSGSAATRGAVGRLVVNLGHSDLFVEPFISTTTTADGQPVTFTGSVGLARNVLSKRYDDLDSLLKTGGTR